MTVLLSSQGQYDLFRRYNMDLRVRELIKKIRTDKNITFLLALAAVGVFIAQIVYYVQKGEVFSLKRGFQALFLSVTLFLLFAVLQRITKTGKPFDKTIVTLLRVMAVVVIVGGVLPSCVEVFIVVIRGGIYTIDIADLDIFVPVLGVMIGIFSEIFSYGNDLQEDNDMIA